MVNGVAGYNTPDRQAVRDVMQSFPSPASVDLLRRLGIRSVVAVRDRVAGTPYSFAADVPTMPGITRREIGPDVLYTID